MQHAHEDVHLVSLVNDHVALKEVHILLRASAIFHLDRHLENLSRPNEDAVYLEGVSRVIMADLCGSIPRNSRTRLSSSAILFLKRVFSSTVGSSLQRLKVTSRWTLFN